MVDRSAGTSTATGLETASQLKSLRSTSATGMIAGAGSKLETTPDVVFRDAQGTPVAVTDSKYKRLGSRPKAPDTYQVLTAGHVLGCQRISLTYAVAHDRQPTVWSVSSALGSSDIELTALPLNLMALTLPEAPRPLIDTICAWLGGELFDDGAT